MDMNLEQVKPVINWIKGHLVIALMSILIIAFLAAGWYFSSAMSVELTDEIADRKKNFQKIEQAGKSRVSLPLTDGEFEANGVLNKQLLDSMRSLTEKMKVDLESAREQTLRHNGDPYPGAVPHPGFADRQSGAAEGSKRLLVSEQMFPNPPSSELEDLPNKVHESLIAAYAQMLKEANAGSPPSPGSLSDTLLREQSRFIQLDKRKAARSDLSDAEVEELTKKLTETRLQIYNQAASDISFYATASAFDLPASPFATKTQHSLAELYDWHWDWWVAEDIIAAIVNANTDPKTGKALPVIQAPVKRLLSVTTLDSNLGSIGPSSSSSGRSSKGRGGSSGRGEPTPSGGALPEPNVGMDAAIKQDFEASITGRTSNDLLDVRVVEVVLVVETEALPRFINALAQVNFMTITNLSIAPTSAFTAASQGFVYGERPVSLVNMEIETLWFRKWTAAWMPMQVREAFGIKSSNAG
ncbi:MAG: hypothetical protein VX641_05955 [Planctomycetota bacterium]|nr:hypothetical protein [Planctomycetota bacterium]